MVSSRPANADSPARTASHFSSAVSPGIRLVVAIAPALTSGFMVRSALSSTAISELNGKPVQFTPRLCRAASYPSWSHTRANTNGLETLWIENLVSTSPISNDRPRTPTTADAEQVRRRSPGRDVVGDHTVGVRSVALVGLGDDALDLRRGGELAGRDRRRSRLLVEREAPCMESFFMGIPLRSVARSLRRTPASNQSPGRAHTVSTRSQLVEQPLSDFGQWRRPPRRGRAAGGRQSPRPRNGRPRRKHASSPRRRSPRLRIRRRERYAGVPPGRRDGRAVPGPRGRARPRPRAGLRSASWACSR